MSSLAKIKNRCFGYQQLIPLIKPSKTKKLQYPSNKSTKTNFKKPSPTKYRMKKSNSQKKIPNINPILTNLNFKHKLTKNHSYKILLFCFLYYVKIKNINLSFFNNLILMIGL